MFRKYLMEEIERFEDKEAEEALDQWCNEISGLKESAFKAGFEAALLWVKELILERTVEQKYESQRYINR